MTRSVLSRPQTTMLRYCAGRLAALGGLLLAVSMLTFASMNVLGDPLFNILGPIAGDTENPESIALIDAAKAEYHLDKPLPERYVRWLANFATGDFGVRFASDGQPPVSDLIVERLPRSLMLMAMAQAIALLVAIPWALWSAANADRIVDKASTAGSFMLVSLPNFALAVCLFYVFGLRLGWVPLRFNASDPLMTRMYQLVLPALTLGLPASALYQRLLRTDLITTLQEDFILVARSKGVPRRRVLLRHALRPSMFSLVTIFGLNAGALIGGALVVETYFGIPGIGTAIVEAILREDFPVVLAIVMIVATGFVILNFIVDIAYSLIDPRVRS